MQMSCSGIQTCAVTSSVALSERKPAGLPAVEGLSVDPDAADDCGEAAALVGDLLAPA